MSDPNHPCFARIYDPLMALPERLLLREHREYLVDGLAGRVLDVGAGTGAMFPYFADSDTALTVDAIEPDPHMRRQATDRAAEVGLSVDIADARAEALPYEDDTFDAVTAAFVFCTIPDVEAALAELARVCKPGGEFRFVEHVEGSGLNGSFHRLAAPCWFHAAGGCHLNRRTGERFQADDRFELQDFRRFESGLGRLLPIVRGKLTRRKSSVLGRFR